MFFGHRGVSFSYRTLSNPRRKGWIPITTVFCWRPRRDLNPCYRRCGISIVWLRAINAATVTMLRSRGERAGRFHSSAIGPSAAFSRAGATVFNPSSGCIGFEPLSDSGAGVCTCKAQTGNSVKASVAHRCLQVILVISRLLVEALRVALNLRKVHLRFPVAGFDFFHRD